ncbi:hypothetical protein METBIDRAFT_102616 [Metschnikowia bicuspidata var. bicuspidata NRRL YB-4993]|uniref:Uncharacterized protein n=1 Tax=Metschnikowia bicuspidata var. bicuspidata NRRL YB-4993 TaxID=869754 RepID=A0A1A0HGX1_9ASCO|nr:hypothetical protein METBIDRAFT_102616 [Metschnikowia bicuspidata var. bicuspidata NRRL YB-4993]OBA23240.1 hypothetical protein METBIDRAFT_102616 [Metschnikowia bicuspidata var. bicuspidata NRRL YB-4993]
MLLLMPTGGAESTMPSGGQWRDRSMVPLAKAAYMPATMSCQKAMLGDENSYYVISTKHPEEYGEKPLQSRATDLCNPGMDPGIIPMHRNRLSKSRATRHKMRVGLMENVLPLQDDHGWAARSEYCKAQSSQGSVGLGLASASCGVKSKTTKKNRRGARQNSGLTLSIYTDSTGITRLLFGECRRGLRLDTVAKMRVVIPMQRTCCWLVESRHGTRGPRCRI